MNLEINETLDNIKNKNLDFNFENGQKEAGNIVTKVLDKGADYVIKAMPIPDALKDILKDVKNSIKKDGFKNIVKTAVNSSIREGLEILNIPKDIITDIVQIKDVAIKGGLRHNLGNTIDIANNRYTKNNIVGDFVRDFFKSFKDFIFSKDFMTRLEKAFKKVTEKKDKFLDTCKSWYINYEKQDIDKMNILAEDIRSKYSTIKNDKQCERENNIIQNITKLYNEKNEKLSDIELKVCQNM